MLQFPYVTIGLFNPKSAVNVGAVMRAAGCFGVKHIFYSGQRFGYARDFHTDTIKGEAKASLTGVDDLLKAKPAGSDMVVVELVKGATLLPDFHHPDNAYYVFGPEDGSLPKELVQQADHVIAIPSNQSLNLAATVNVVLYDRVAKEPFDVEPDQLIESSRDNNNQLRRL
ncbi:RNA methyltransferase [Aestuariibacter salexigens]|uniref:RNA methyltransferase n=1 Tax=Aestuariibacter salexigens TaxID=226010 RepID=UPI000400D193|nr:RNA methyltransferase [Aestuariibacter salexigens]